MAVAVGHVPASVIEKDGKWRTMYLEDVALSGNLAYVVEYYPSWRYTGTGPKPSFSRLRVIDVSEPASPDEVGVIRDTWPGLAWDIALSGPYAYVATLGAGLQIVDVSDPGDPYARGR